MDNQLYKPGQIVSDGQKDSYSFGGGAVRIGVQGPQNTQFALNVNNFPDTDDDSRIITLGKYGIYYLDLTGGLGLIQNICFESAPVAETVLIDYLSIDSQVEGVQNEL